MAQFTLMYVVGPGPAPPSLSPEELPSVVSEYTAWGEKMGADGRMVGGARLTDVYTDPGRVCTGNDQDFVVTDGGSIQEESSYIGLPCLLLRKATERREGIGANVVVSHYDENVIRSFARDAASYRREPVADAGGAALGRVTGE